MKIIFIDEVGRELNPKERERPRRVAFSAEGVVVVREILAIGTKVEKRTKIVFRGDEYEHHAIETDEGFDEVIRKIGWDK